jgi:hypothetical protein
MGKINICSTRFIRPQRTGLILTASAFGGVLFKTTTLLDRVATLVEWEKFADEAIAEAAEGARE